MKNSFSTRSIIAILLVIGYFTLAVLDEQFRSGFANLAFAGVGGYLGQLIPKQQRVS